MPLLHRTHNKRNELLEVEFYANNECTELFDFTDKKNLYIELKNGDISPITAIHDKILKCTNIYVPYIPSCQRPFPDTVKTIEDITPNLSQYIPEDNAVLFLSLEDCNKYGDIFQDINSYYTYPNIECEQEGYSLPRDYNKVTIFLPQGTQAKLEKANEVAEYLWKNFGIKPDLFVMHYFPKLKPRYRNDEVKLFDIKEDMYEAEYFSCFNKIITTNSTGILEPQNTERLQVIDCKEIFEDYLNLYENQK